MSLHAQDFEDVLEAYASLLGEEDLSHLYDELLDLWEHPINLNLCNDEEIQALFMLSLHEKEALIDYLQRYRPLDAVAELLLVKGWTPYTLQKVRDFVCLTAIEKEWNAKSKSPYPGRWQVKQKFNRRFGETVGDSSYVGSLLSQAYQLSYQHSARCRFGFCFDKDEGEKWGDHQAAYVEICDRKSLQQLIIGDYRMHFGQGLVVSSSGLFGGKSHAGHSLLSQNKTFRAQTSGAESGYFRGLASIWKLSDKSSLAICGALQNIDTNLQDSSFSAIKTDGLHRKEKDLEKKRNVQRMTVGLRQSYRYDHFQWAINAFYYHFDREWQADEQAYKLYYFQGKDGANFSADWRWRIGDCFWGGEWAFDHQGHWAAICHLNAKLHNQIKLSLSLRHFQKEYQAPFAMTFSEKTTVCNEEGLYIAGDFQLQKNCHIRCYVDCYRFPWLRHGVNAPSYGWDSQIDGDWQLNDVFCIKWRYKEKHQQENVVADLAPIGVRPVQATLTRSARGQVIMDAETLRFKSSLQWTQCEQKTAFCLAQEIYYQWTEKPLSINLQHAIFDGDKGLSSYLYSSELSGGMPFVNLSGKGQLVSGLIKYRYSEHIQCHIRARVQAYKTKSALTNIGMLLTFKF